jgi:Domain of unknown function (DUF5666)
VAADTILDGYLAVGAIAAGDRIEVSGLRDSGSNAIRATRLSRHGAQGGTVLTGSVANAAPGRFTLGTLTVLYDASALRDAPPGGLANGLLVRMKSPFAPSASQITASEVRVLSLRSAAPAGVEVSIEGVVSRLAASSFDLGGVKVRYDARTKLRNGTAADLLNGAIVEAEGLLDAQGALVAEEIKFPQPDMAEAEALVQSVSADGFMLLGAGGIRVEVNSATRFRDKSRARLPSFGLRDVRVGDRIAVKGWEVEEGAILATEVERMKPASGVTLNARVRSIAQPDVVLLSVRAATSGATVYRDENGVPIGADAFFARAAGRRLFIAGQLSGTTVQAASMRIDP